MRKDLRVVTQSKSVMLPMIILPLLLLVIMPGGITLAMSYFATSMGDPADVAEMAALAPPALLEQFAGATPVQMAVLFVLRYMVAPLYLIMPLMVASVVAADSFAGEKERKTLEALIYTPTSDAELLLAKLLGGFVPAVVVAWLSALLYWLVGNAAAWPLFGYPILPTAEWLLLALWVAPAAAALGLSATVLVSSRAKTFQDAYQVSGLIVLPIVLLMIGQTTGLFYLSLGLVALVGLVFWLIAAALLVIAVRLFSRSEILARL